MQIIYSGPLMAMNFCCWCFCCLEITVCWLSCLSIICWI